MKDDDDDDDDDDDVIVMIYLHIQYIATINQQGIFRS